MIRICPHLHPGLPLVICQGQCKMWSYCACLCKAVMRAFQEMESVHSKNQHNKIVSDRLINVMFFSFSIELSAPWIYIPCDY